MKHLFTTAAVLFSMTAFAQVGINNTSPKATLDITAKTSGTKPEGLIIPQLAGSDIHTATAAGVYGAAQKGLIVYASSADTNPTGPTANITAAGYYYFDGTNWQKVMTGSVGNTDLAAGVGGIYKGSGSLSGNTIVTQGANTLAFNSTATNGFSVDGTTLSVDAANDRIGIGTAAPQARIHISGAGGAGGDHLRMTNSASDWALASENAGAQNGIPGKSSLTITNRIGNYRAMTIGNDNSFRFGGDISTGNATLSIDGPTRNVGIGINVPNATLDVKAASNGSSPEGIIAPRLSLTALQGYTYGTNQTGAIVYVNSVSGTPAGQTANVTAVGYYFFDGSAWQKIMSGSVANGDLAAGVGGIYKGSGSLSGNTTVAQGANTLAFTSTATNGFSVDGTTLSVDAANNRVGIGTSAPQKPLHVNANNSSIRFENLPSLPTGTSSTGLVVDNNGDIYQNNTVSTEGQILRIGLNSATYSNSEVGLRFNLHDDSTEMVLAPNGGSNFISTITGATISENVTLSAGSGTPSRTTDQIVLQPGVYKVQLRILGNFAAQNNSNALYVKYAVNNNEYSFLSFSNSSNLGNVYYFDDYINITGTAQTVDFTIAANTNNFTIISRSPVGSSQSYRSLIMIQRLR